jgi:hypothetical protein
VERRVEDIARFPWASPLAAGLLLGLLALKAVHVREHRHSILSLCEDDFAVANFWMGLAELSGGLCLFAPSQRVAGATIGLTAMTCAAGYSLWAGIARISLAGCGCFGPFDAPWWVHFLVASAVAAACAAARASRPVPAIRPRPASAPSAAARSSRREPAGTRRSPRRP